MAPDTMMEVDTKDGTTVEDNLTYQPQADIEPAETLTELKPVKQSVTYDSQTGKMYAELGTSSNPDSRQVRVDDRVTLSILTLTWYWSRGVFYKTNHLC